MAPAGLAFDGSHLFAATGHTNDVKQWGGANFGDPPGPDLRWQTTPEDFFAPADWQKLDPGYVVLAYNNPLAFDLPDGGPGPRCSSRSTRTEPRTFSTVQILAASGMPSYAEGAYR